ncbi:hypothetical protein DL96DRAFT_1685151 [Flagelloscypha sp. PMI_526]|nr:hypothetical protein DL96DRAFT_1685151 [Flagelloscypha sp. PMI_526]
MWEYDGLASSLEYLNQMPLSYYLSIPLAGSAARLIVSRMLKNSWHPLDIEQLVSVHPKRLGRLIRAEKDMSPIPDVIESIGYQKGRLGRRRPNEQLHVRMQSLPRERQFGGWIIYDSVLEGWRNNTLQFHVLNRNKSHRTCFADVQKYFCSHNCYQVHYDSLVWEDYYSQLHGIQTAPRYASSTVEFCR